MAEDGQEGPRRAFPRPRPESEGIVDDRAVGEDISAVAAHIVDQPLGERNNLLRRYCFYYRGRHVSAEAGPAPQPLLHFPNIRLIEDPNGGAGGDIGIGNDVEPLVVGALDE